jgi:hypothetical protein
VKGRDRGRWFVSLGVRSRNIEDGAVLLEIDEGRCCQLNVLGAQVWFTIENSPAGIELSRIVDGLATRFQIPRQQLEKDTSDWLNKLEELGFLNQLGREIPESP